MKPRQNPKKKSFLVDLFGNPVLPLHGALRVKKRDGHIEPFSLQKLAQSIRNALQSAGVDDNTLDYSLATAIKTYLRECYGLEAIIPTQEIYEVTIQTLQEMGQKKTLRTYEEFARQKKLHQRLIQPIKTKTSHKKSDHTVSQNTLNIPLQSADTITPKIEDILQPLQLKKELHKKITAQILDILTQIHYPDPSPSFLSELCSLILKQEQITHPQIPSFISLSVPDCLELLKTIQTENWTPEDTNTLLGKKVKEAIARSHIFSSQTADAHDEGLIYIHTFDQFDKLGFLHLPTHFLWSLPRDKTSHIQTPHDFWSLLTDMYYDWSDFFIEPIQVWAFNWSIAPLLKGLEGNDYQKWLLQWIEDCEQMTDEIPGLQVIFDWAIPEKWAQSHAIGTKRKNLGTPYSAYQQPAQEMITDLLECINQRTTNDHHLSRSLLWRFPLPLTIAPSHSFWSLLASCVEDKEIPMSVYFTPLQNLDLLPHIGLSGITINLARIAFKNPTETSFYSHVFQSILLAIQSHEEMVSFLTTHYSDTRGNIWKPFMEQIYKNPTDIPPLTAFPINLFISGTQEAIEILHYDQKLKNLDKWHLTEQILNKIKTMLTTCTKDKNLKINLCIETNKKILRKLAQKDTEEFPDLFAILNREETFLYNIQYSDELVPLSFYHPEELIPQFHILFQIAPLFNAPVPARFAQQRLWDSILLGEVMHLFNQACQPNASILLHFPQSE